MSNQRLYRWLRSHFGIILPNTSKDYIESFFKWISYNAAIAIVIRYIALLISGHKWLVVVPSIALNLVFLNLTVAYGVAELVLPLLDEERGRRKSSAGVWLVLAAISCLQFTFWKISGAFVGSSVR